MESNQNITLETVESAAIPEDISSEKYVSFEEYDCDKEYLVDDGSKNKNVDNVENSISLDSNDSNVNQDFDFNTLIDSFSNNQNVESFANKSECISNQGGTDLNSILENILCRKSVEEEQNCDTIINNGTNSSHSIFGSIIDTEISQISDSFTEDIDLNPINIGNLINIYDGPQYEKDYINESSNIQLINENVEILNNEINIEETREIDEDNHNSLKQHSFATIQLNPQFQNINSNENSSVELLNENMNTEIVNEENNLSDKIEDGIYEKDDTEDLLKSITVLKVQSQSQNINSDIRLVSENINIEIINVENDVICIEENNCVTDDTIDDLVQEKDSLQGIEPQSFAMLRVKSPTKLNQQLNASKVINSQEEMRLKDTEQSQEQNIELKIVLMLGNENEQICNECYLLLNCKFLVKYDKNEFNICRDSCLTSFCVRKKINSYKNKGTVNIETNLQVKPVLKNILSDTTTTENNILVDASNKKKFIRKCAECFSKINTEANNNIINWQVMEFCNVNCLGDYQTKILSYCGFCKFEIIGNNIGRFCVRFGNKINQFCDSTCLEKYKTYLKICSYCQKDICCSTEGFSAPIGNKFKDFCSAKCMELFDFLINRNTKRKIEIGHCSVCNDERQFLITYERLGNIQKFCCDPCFVAFKFVNKIDPLQCITCKKYYKKKIEMEFSIYYDSNIKHFCSETCQNVYIITNRKIIACNWCKVNKYNFDLIYKESSGSSGQALYMCSLHCLRLFQESNNTIRAEKQTCSSCLQLIQAEFHLTMSDSTIRSFCNTKCINYYLQKYANLKLADNVQNQSGPSKSATTYTGKGLKIPPLKLKTAPNPTALFTRPTSEKTNATTTQIIYYPYQNSNQNSSKNTRQVIIKPRPHPIMKNKSTSCKPITRNKSSLHKPRYLNKRLQTDDTQIGGIKSLLPIPVPIYVPTPVPIYRQPIPITIPFPIPIAVPIFIPTIRNSIKGITKELKKIKDNFPSDPLEAEMVQMAKLAVGNDNKINYTDSESEENSNTEITDLVYIENDPKYKFEAKNDLPLKNIVNEPLNIDLESSLIANEISLPKLDIKSPKKPTRSKYRRIVDISQCQTIKQESNDEVIAAKSKRKCMENDDNKENICSLLDKSRSDINIRRSKRAALKNTEEIIEEKRLKIIDTNNTTKLSTNIEIRKTGDDLSLKYMYGVNAWRQWVNKKNIELKNATQKLFVDQILELTSNELNCSLCLFVQEVRKPDGTNYAPDTIYYLCLGIQLYLLENGRSDNIFSDFSYKNFIDSFDVVSKRFSSLYEDSNYIVTRVEEEYLWESIQLGVFSPYTLLTTLIYYNTLYFNLISVEDHMNISFLHIVKCHKGNSKIVSLRCYPPLYSHKKTKKMRFYEIFENKKNIYRCPIKLYDFYINKCPDSVKKRDDIFYLLPERSCVADSPVWFSNHSLESKDLEKILLRIKMVREINEALLASRVIG